VDNVPRLADLLINQLASMVNLGQTLRTATNRHDALKSGLIALYREQLTRHEVVDIDAGLTGLALDIELNAQGLGIWLDRDAR
jgi:hypothetical protein